MPVVYLIPSGFETGSVRMDATRETVDIGRPQRNATEAEAHAPRLRTGPVATTRVEAMTSKGFSEQTARSEELTRVLVIEDDHHLRDLLEIVLDLEEGIDVATLADERQALDAYRHYQPDVVVLDLMLPHMSGEEVAARLRAEEPDVRIISISGMDPEPRPWANHQLVKTGNLVEELHRALELERNEMNESRSR